MWCDVISLSLSVLAILGGLYTYLVHDKKLKYQQESLNDLQIKKLKKEIKENNSIEIRPTLINVTSPIDMTHRLGTISLRNYGKAEATDVRVCAYVKGVRSHYNNTQRRIDSLWPDQCVEIPISWDHMNAVGIDVLISWRDENQEVYSASHTLQIY